MAKKGSGSTNKAAIIREALGKGIESPAAISAYAKQTKGLAIDPKYVSVIKSNIRTKEKGRPRRGRASHDSVKETMHFALKNGGIDKAMKVLEAVRGDSTLTFAANMGGVDQAIAALNELASHIAK